MKLNPRRNLSSLLPILGASMAFGVQAAQPDTRSAADSGQAQARPTMPAGAADRAGTAAGPTTAPGQRADRSLDRRPGTPDAIGRRGEELVLNVDRARLERAPGFEDSRWPDFGDAGYRGEIDRYWSDGQASAQPARTQPPAESALQASPQMIQPTAWRASALLDAKVSGSQGDDIGDIEDFVVDAQTGQLRYAVIAFDRGWFRSDKLVAVRADALTPRDKDRVVFQGTSEQVAKAPAFDRDNWPDLNEPGYRSSVDAYLGQPVGTGGATTDGTAAGAAARR